MLLQCSCTILRVSVHFRESGNLQMVIRWDVEVEWYMNDASLEKTG